MKPAVLAALLLVSTLTHAQAPQHVHVVSDDAFSDMQSPQQNERIATVVRAVDELRRQGRLPQATLQAETMDLAWPLLPTGRFNQFDYHGTSNFVDHGPPYPGPIQDYNCGTRSYNLPSGYNHAGTDYYLWPFPWSMMDEGQVQIVAAAPGVIVGKDDGNFDRNCSLSGSASPNIVYVLQDDGLTAIYMHMRNGSVTTQAVGTRVAAGDYLGLVGSSGSSTGPHLHFELRDAAGAVVDPRNGQCNAAPERWIVFQPYEDPHIDTLSTHSAEPVLVGCGVDSNGNAVAETPNYKDEFTPGDEMWVFASYRDQRNGQITHFSITRPDATPFAQWDFDLASQNNPNPFYSGSSVDWKFTLPTNAPIGVWMVTALFQGQTYTRTFTVGLSLPPWLPRLPRPPRQHPRM